MLSLKSVFVDYHVVDMLVLVLLAIIWGYLSKVNPNRLFIPKRDPRCTYPHYDSGITELANLCVVIIVPFSIYILIYISFKLNFNTNYIIPFDILGLFCAHLGSIFLTNILVNCVKLQVGRPRPDFFSVLGPNATSEINCPEDLSLKQFHEEFKSFPSGHSASAMCGSLFFVLFLNKAITSNQQWVFILLNLPLIYPIIIGCTRITEHRHHTDDVVMGLFLGTILPISFYLTRIQNVFTTTVKP